MVADALAFAHAHGVLHRDVKPQNVLVLPTSWVLADFGIARLVDTEHTASVERFTYRHASPQLLDGLPPTAADDIWALGSTLFTLLDGRPPFASDDPDEDSALAYLRRVRTEEHRELTQHEGQGDTAPLMAVVDRCLAKDLGERYASAEELRDALAAVQVHGWEPGAPVTPLTPTSTPVIDPVPTRCSERPGPTQVVTEEPAGPPQRRPRRDAAAEPPRRRRRSWPSPSPWPSPCWRTARRRRTRSPPAAAHRASSRTAAAARHRRDTARPTVTRGPGSPGPAAAGAGSC